MKSGEDLAKLYGLPEEDVKLWAEKVGMLMTETFFMVSRNKANSLTLIQKEVLCVELLTKLLKECE